MLGAPPQSALPVSKMTTCDMYSHLMFRTPYTLLLWELSSVLLQGMTAYHGRIVLAEPNAKAVPSHDSLETSPNSLMMLGWTLATLHGDLLVKSMQCDCGIVQLLCLN